MEDKLKFIFSNVVEWLKFAEAKLAGIIVFNGAVIIGIMQTTVDLPSFNISIKHAIYFLLFGNLFSLIISLFGLSPMSKRLKLKGKLITEDDNLLYYSDIIKYTPEKYLSVLEDKYKLKRESTMESDLAEQIIQISKIAQKKYEYFRFCIIFTTGTFLAGLIVLLL